MGYVRSRVAKSDPSRSDRQVQTTCLLILTFIASGFALWALRPVLVPFVLALFFTYWLTPLIDVQERRLGVRRGMAVANTAILALALLSGIGTIIASSVAKPTAVTPPKSADTGGVPETKPYESDARRVVAWIAQTRPGRWLGISPESEALKIPAETARAFVQNVLQETTVIISNGALVIVFVIFMLMGRGITPRMRPALLVEIESRVKRYLVVMISLSVLTGLLVGTALAILGVPFAAVFGLLALLLNFIPTLGAIVATLLPLPVVLLTEMPVPAKIMAIAIPGAIQGFIGAVQPKIQGDALEIHPVAILLALIFFGTIWGIAGAFLATPLVAVIKIVLEHLPATRSLASLLAGDLSTLSYFAASATPAGTVAPEEEEAEALMPASTENEPSLR